MTDNSKRPIIVIKKKAAHAGHHGGAWKVAYADFVTAMMALFIVLWLTSSGEKVRKSIAGYFNDPNGTGKELGTDRNGGEGTPLDKENISHLKEQLQKEIAKRPDLKPMADQIQIAITPEGMRIELIESKDGTFFESGSAVLNNTGKELLALLAKELGGVPNHISTEGHTDSQPYADATKHDNWDLSTERANSARRLMQATGLHLGQISQVRGFADQNLRLPLKPFDPSNRRISVIVHYIESTPVGFDPKAPTADQAGTKDATKAVGDTAGKTGTPEKPLAAVSAAEAAKQAGAPAPASAAPALPAGLASGAKPGAVQSLLKKLPAMPSMPKLPNAGGAIAKMKGKVTGIFSHKAKAPEAATPQEKQP